ncbi:hypothetical protein ACFQU2_21645 [Siccirubricoccus deserti]
MFFTRWFISAISSTRQRSASARREAISSTSRNRGVPGARRSGADSARIAATMRAPSSTARPTPMRVSSSPQAASCISAWRSEAEKMASGSDAAAT